MTCGWTPTTHDWTIVTYGRPYYSRNPWVTREQLWFVNEQLWLVVEQLRLVVEQVWLAVKHVSLVVEQSRFVGDQPWYVGFYTSCSQFVGEEIIENYMRTAPLWRRRNGNGITLTTLSLSVQRTLIFMICVSRCWPHESSLACWLLATNNSLFSCVVYDGKSWP